MLDFLSGLWQLLGDVYLYSFGAILIWAIVSAILSTFTKIKVIRED